MDSYTLRFIEGKKLTQDQLIPAIIMLIGGKGGRATKKYVEENVYDIFEDEFHKRVYTANWCKLRILESYFIA